MKLKKLTPNFAVEDIKKTVEFYQNVLGFKLESAVAEDRSGLETEINPAKEYLYAMMSKDGVEVMFQRIDNMAQDIPSFKDAEVGASVSFYMESEDVDAVSEELKEKVEIVKEIETTWYGMRELYVKDCNGYVLCFAQDVREK